MSVVLSDLLQSLLDFVMLIHLSSFQDSLYLAVILSFLPERQKTEKIGKWRRKGKQHMQHLEVMLRASDVTWLVQPEKEETEGRPYHSIQLPHRGKRRGRH